jgi:hypothetical protein
MESFIDKEDLVIFLKDNVIKLIEKQKIQWNISKDIMMRYLITGTMKFSYIYNKRHASVYLTGPYIRHDNFEEDYEYWNHLFSSEFWLEIAEKAEKYLLFPEDFSQRWASHLSEWLYCFIDPESSPVFQEYYSREPEDEDILDGHKDKIDPYLADYKGDYSFM